MILDHVTAGLYNPQLFASMNPATVLELGVLDFRDAGKFALKNLKSRPKPR